jgi:hypothetical protein
LAADPLRSVPFLAALLPPTDPAEAALLATSPECLRQRRAVMALEYSATPAARQVLRTLATANVATSRAEEAR